MDIQQKLKQMYDRADRESFTHRFYKQSSGRLNEGDIPDNESANADARFKQVEWFTSKNSQEVQNSGGVLELAAPLLPRKTRVDQTSARPTSKNTKFSTTNQLHQSNEILDSLQHKGVVPNADITIRSTKVVCTLGRVTKHEENIAKMIRKGMNVARINMNYFEIHEQGEIINNIKRAALKENKDISIMVDLKGPLIRTLGFKDTSYSIKVHSGQEIRISTNPTWKGDENLFVIDYENIAEKLLVGDKVLIDYGGVVLTVIGFESEEKYLMNQLRKKKHQGQHDASSNPSYSQPIPSQGLIHLHQESVSNAPLPKLLDGLMPSPQISINGDNGQTSSSPQRAVATMQFVKSHTYSEDGEGEIYGRNMRRDIEELIDEENQTSSDHLREDLEDNLEDSKDPNLEALGSGNQEGGKYYPPVSKIDTQTQSQHSQHKVTAEELEQEQAIFNEVLKKSYQGFTAQKISKITELARSKKIENLDLKMENVETNPKHTSVTSKDALAYQKESNSAHHPGKTFFEGYKMKLTNKEDGAVKEPHMPTDQVTGNLEDHLWASRKAQQNQKQIGKALTLPSKDFLAKKRMSRDDLKNRALTLPSLSQLCTRDGGNTSARISTRSRKSLSPVNSHRNQYHGASHSTFQQQVQQAQQYGDNVSQASHPSECDSLTGIQAPNHFSTFVSHNLPSLDATNLAAPNQGSNPLLTSSINHQHDSTDFLDLSHPLLEKEKILVVCRVENDGEIKENKPIYIPGLDWAKDLNLSVLGPNDVKVLHNSIQQGVHMIAVSCVESKDDIIYVKKVLGSKGQHIKVLAKLQSQKALQNFDSILEVSDGIVIARGYLSLSLDMEDVVYVQKYIIKKCNTVGMPVLLSTQILESMVTQLIPSRSEVVDISNAVYDGIDALILSPETASGVFYEQATDTMSHICLEAEKHINYLKRYHDQQRLLRMHLYNAKEASPQRPISELWSTEDSISSCAVKASFDVKASLIIVFTHSGLTARKVAKHKPKCPIISVTPNDWVAKSILIHRGVHSLVVGSLIGQDTLTSKVMEQAKQKGFIKHGDYIVITSGLSGTVGSTNLLKIVKV